MSNPQIEEIELSIEEAQKLIDRKNQLEKLFTNREFRKLIEEGYFKGESARLVAALGDPNLGQHRAEIMRSMDGIGALQQYFRTILQIGRMAEQELAEAREMLDETEAGMEVV